MSEQETEKAFRVWLFNMNESSNTSYNCDNYGDIEYEVTYDIQGAECVDVSEQELADLRVGLQRCARAEAKAILVRDLRKQDSGEYAKCVSDLIRVGAGIREMQRLEGLRKAKQAEARKKKGQQDQAEKKRKQLAKLQKELAELES